MRRSRALKHGHWHYWLSLLVAGMIGYLIGDWHALAVHTAGLSASQNVALRFPEAKPDTAILDSGIQTLAGPGGSIALNDASSVLLSPAPMVARPTRQVAVQVAAQAPQALPSQQVTPTPQAPVRVATAEDAVPLPAQAAAPAPRAAPVAAPRKAEPKPAAPQPKSELKSASAAAADRNGMTTGPIISASLRAGITATTPPRHPAWSLASCLASLRRQKYPLAKAR